MESHPCKERKDGAPGFLGARDSHPSKTRRAGKPVLALRYNPVPIVIPQRSKGASCGAILRVEAQP